MTFIVLQKDVRSLNSSERFEELTQEVEGCMWDAILISETWRASNAQIWETQQGHMFMGAEKFKNKHEVGHEVEKTCQLDRLHQRTRHINVDHSQQTTCIVDECVLPPLGWGPPRWKIIQMKRETHEIQKEEHTNCGRILQCWNGTRAWCWTCQCWTAHTQGGKQERRPDEAMTDDTTLHKTQHDVQKNAWKASYLQDPERCRKHSWTFYWWTGNTCVAAETPKQTTWSTWETTREVLWHNLWLQHQRRKSHKKTHIAKKKIQTAESTKSHYDAKTRSDEANKF